MKKERLKRTLAGLVLGAVIFLTACTGQGGSVSVPAINVPAGQASTETSNTATTAATDQGDLDGDTDVTVKVTTDNRTFTGDFYDEEKTLLTQVRQQVHLVSGNEQVGKFLEQYNEKKFAESERDAESALADRANEFYCGYGTGLAAQYDVTYEFRRVDKHVLSMYDVTVAYMGGAHPASYVSSQNYDMQTGKKIAFTDLVKDIKAFAQVAYETLKNDEEYAPIYEIGGYSETLDKDTYVYLQNDALAWTITNEGIELWYGDYQAGAYASGQIVLLIPYAEHRDLIDGKYFENVEEYDVTSRVSVDRAQPVTFDAFDYCFQTYGFFPYDFNLISGKYAGEDGSTITIYEYGTFVYEKGTDYIPGEIRAIEGGFLLITGFYNEEKNQYENENRGTLSYSGDCLEGGLNELGTQKYSLEEKFEREGNTNSNPWSGVEITLEGCDIVLYEGTLNEHPYDEADMSIDEYSRSFWLYANTDVYNLRLFNVNMVPSAQYGLVPEVGELWFSKQHFTEDDLWRVTISIPGDLPCNGFSYENAADETRYYVIGESGADGSLYIEAFTSKK